MLKQKTLKFRFVLYKYNETLSMAVRNVLKDVFPPMKTGNIYKLKLWGYGHFCEPELNGISSVLYES